MELPLKSAEPPVAEGITWGPVAAIIATIVGFFAAQIIGAVLLLGVATVFGGHNLAELRANDSFLRDTTYVFTGNILISLVLLAITCRFIQQRQGSFRSIGLKAFRAVDILYALSGYFVYFVIYISMTVFIQANAPHLLDQNQDLGFSRTASGIALVPIFFSLVILPPVVEEILFRGFLYSGLKKKLPVIASTIITSLIFASAHLLGGETNALLWIAAIDTFVLSLVLCRLREKTGRLWASMLVHGMKNFIAFAAIFIFKLS